MHPLTAETVQRIETLVDAMTLEEQVSLLSGADFWSLPAISRLGIGALRVTDGPNGARGAGTLIGGVRSAAFPVGVALGASWNPDLMAEIGRALAEEVKSKQAHVSLSPTVNLQRTATNGRNFECYSEDPILTAELAVALINGLQSQGIGATIKHFVGNESEIERTTISSEIDERTLREMYLVPFEAAVKRAGVWAVMSSYNRLGGTYTSEHAWLLTQVLRRDWGFDGVVMSDWFGSHSTVPTLTAGLDLEMPGPARDRGPAVVEAVASGALPAAVVRERALNILRLAARTGALDDHRPFAEAADDRPEHRALIRRAGAEGMVLLKNQGLLPLDPGLRLAVIGPNAKVAQIMGGGSSQLNAHYRRSPWDGLVAAVGEEALTHAPGCSHQRYVPPLSIPFEVAYFDNEALEGVPAATGRHEGGLAFWFGRIAEGKIDASHFSARLTGVYRPQTGGLHDLGLFSAGRARVLVDGVVVAEAWEDWTRGTTFFEEGCEEVRTQLPLLAGRDYRITVEFRSHPFAVLAVSALQVGIAPAMGDADLAHAAEVAAAADVALLFIGRDASWDTEGADVPMLRLPGRQDDLVRAVVAANPRTLVVLQTGGPVEMPWIDSVPALLQAWYPGQEAGNAIADVLLGKAEPGGRLAQSFPARWSDVATQSQDAEIYPGLNGKVRYEEGVFTGYRHHDRTGTPPLFPFGFGLSYSRFALTAASVHPGDAAGSFAVTVRLANQGGRAGSEVVQLYVEPPACPVRRPLRELKAFAKRQLAAGQAEDVLLPLNPRDFAWFDTGRGAWVVTAGRYGLHLGTNAADLPIRLDVTLPDMVLPV